MQDDRSLKDKIRDGAWLTTQIATIATIFTVGAITGALAAGDTLQYHIVDLPDSAEAAAYSNGLTDGYHVAMYDYNVTELVKFGDNPYNIHMRGKMYGLDMYREWSDV